MKLSIKKQQLYFTKSEANSSDGTLFDGDVYDADIFVQFVGFGVDF